MASEENQDHINAWNRNQLDTILGESKRKLNIMPEVKVGSFETVSICCMLQITPTLPILRLHLPITYICIFVIHTAAYDLFLYIYFLEKWMLLGQTLFITILIDKTAKSNSGSGRGSSAPISWKQTLLPLLYSLHISCLDSDTKSCHYSVLIPDSPTWHCSRLFWESMTLHRTT